jgi:tRNA-specific 2-thiouridylase
LAGYTVGQRKGLGLGGGKEALFVVRLEPERNTVVVGGGQDVFSAGLTAEAVSWTGRPPQEAFRAQVRIRHRHEPAEATVTPVSQTEADVVFNQPQRAVTPGQAAVFYQGEEVLGGGTITVRRKE